MEKLSNHLANERADGLDLIGPLAIGLIKMIIAFISDSKGGCDRGLPLNSAQGIHRAPPSMPNPLDITG
jgi:hypothetical protein